MRIAEFNLRSARGIYDPLLGTESYYEARTNADGFDHRRRDQRFGYAESLFRLGWCQRIFAVCGRFLFGGFHFFADDDKQHERDAQSAISGGSDLYYVQPLFRGRRFDNNRRQIEIAKKNLSLTDSQFRQRAIEVIAQVEQAYWDLVFSLRNLQVQIDAVKQARTQLESNQRLVAKGVLAPIDIVAANAQITTFEQNVYTAQEDVTRAENTLKTLMLPDRTASELVASDHAGFAISSRSAAHRSGSCDRRSLEKSSRNRAT